MPGQARSMRSIGKRRERRGKPAVCVSANCRLLFRFGDELRIHLAGVIVGGARVGKFR
jgi:hypothetical protein